MARCGCVATLAVVALVGMMAPVQGSMAVKFPVGDINGWQRNPYGQPNFYQDWANSHSPFFTTDSLEFKWLLPDSVHLVNAADFNTCYPGNPIQAWVARPDGMPTTMVFPLAGHGFASGYINNCDRGEKFFIDVSH